MDYISAREAAQQWKISQRRVSVLCSEGRIKDAVMVGNMWIIPSDAKKPEDARSTRKKSEPQSTLRPFLKWAGGKGQLLQKSGNVTCRRLIQVLQNMLNPLWVAVLCFLILW